jgi:hypothetical protein
MFCPLTKRLSELRSYPLFSPSPSLLAPFKTRENISQRCLRYVCVGLLFAITFSELYFPKVLACVCGTMCS